MSDQHMSFASTPSRQLPVWRHHLADFLAGKRGALVLPLVIAVVLLLFPDISGQNAYWIRELSLIGVLVLVVSGVNLSFGYAGEVQFGQVFMYAVGAYLTAALAVHGLTDIIVLMVIGAAAATLIGALIAFPALRIGGWSLAMASFFLVITIPGLVALLQKYTGGLNGLIGIPSPTLFGTELGANGLFYVTIVVTILWLACYRNLVTSRYGVTLRVLRESPVLTDSIGFSPSRLKLLAYALGALPAGIAGCLFGFLSQVVVPGTFGLSLAIGIVAASVLGGVESVYGAVAGAAILQLGPENSVAFAEYAPIAYGLFLIVAAVVFRRGLGGLGKYAALRVSRLIAPIGMTVRTVDDGDVVTAGKSSPLSSSTFAPDATAIRARAASELRVEGISKAFGGLKALRNVSLDAKPGQVTALIGSNGSGKTTLLNVICGYSQADAGTVEFGGDQLHKLSPHRVARRGVGRTFQTPIIPRGLSVLDVVASGRFSVQRCGALASTFRLPRYWRTRRADRSVALALLETVGLAYAAEEEASAMSLGVRRLVEVARALAGEPSLLLLDEPASGLSEAEVERLGVVLQLAADAGATVVLIEHNFRFVTSVAQRIHVLHVGSLLVSGTPSEVARDQRVIESYLGSSRSPERSVETPPTTIGGRGLAVAGMSTDEQTRNAEIAAPILEVKDVVSGYGDLRVLQGISFSMQGAGVGLILGRNGVGKTTLLSVISGQLKPWHGAALLEGRDISRRPAYKRAAAGVALVQEGKRIFRHRTVRENVVLGTHTLRISRAERRQLCDSVLEAFPVLVERADMSAGGLSGGQQQMLAIAQALASRPKVLLLDEPSAGLAPAIVSEVFQLVRRLADDGMTIVLVEQLAEQALPIADHVTVMDNGQVVTAGPPERFHDMRQLQDAYFGASGGSHHAGADPQIRTPVT